jgi:hypothetical protein
MNRDLRGIGEADFAVIPCVAAGRGALANPKLLGDSESARGRTTIEIVLSAHVAIAD